ncbi:phage prohead protease, HK97 family [compost metagenome]
MAAMITLRTPVQLFKFDRRYPTGEMPPAGRTDPPALVLPSRDPLQGEVSGYASTPAVDRSGDAVLTEAWLPALERLGDSRVPMLLNHDAQRAVGSWHQFSVDELGLFVVGQLASNSEGKDALELVKTGALGLSAAFTVDPADIAMTGGNVRVIRRVMELLEISLVAIPANSGARVVSLKSFSDCRGARDCEHLLRGLGLSKSAATRLAGPCWRSLSPCPELIEDHSPDPQETAFLSALVTLGEKVKTRR